MRIVALVAITLLLVGCVPADPAVTPVPQSSTKPLFASDADALKAATEAYAAYTAQGDSISSGRAEPESISTFVSPPLFKHEMSAFASFDEKGESTRGSTGFDSVTLEKYEDRGLTAFELSIYLCLELSQIRVVDSTGSDVTPAGVRERSPLEVAFIRGPSKSNTLLVDRSEAWPGNDFCN